MKIYLMHIKSSIKGANDMCNFIVPLLIASDQAEEQSQDWSLRASAILSSTTTLTNHKIMHTHNKSTSTNIPEHKQTNKHTGSSVFCFIRTSSPRCSASESVFYLYTIQYYIQCFRLILVPQHGFCISNVRSSLNLFISERCFWWILFEWVDLDKSGGDYIINSG